MKSLAALLMTAAALGLAGPLAAQSTFSCLVNPTVSPALPADTKLSDQDGFNCFGWQEFIALNWKASPTHAGQPDPTATASTFGTPSANGDSPAVVWESYMADNQVFLPGAAPPPPFGTQGSLPSSCAAAGTKLLAPKRSADRFSTGYHVLASTSKFTPKLMRSLAARSSNLQTDDLSSIIQAGSGAWLTGQNGEITYYEVRLNEGEYDYIAGNKLYDATCQQKAVQTGGPGVLLPTSSTTQDGALEIKAAWLPLKDPALYSQYLTAQAVIVNPDGSCQSFVVGLVGLHIIRKTTRAQQLAWATFEHVNNDPDVNQVQAGGLSGYTYYNPNCKPETDPYHCAVNTKPAPCGTSPNPPCNYAAPMQVVRTNPLPGNVVALNNYVHGVIQTANPNSVFRNYQLVNVMWPQRNTTLQPGATTPLTDGNAQPPSGQGGLANTTMETYLQTRTCLNCHVNAPISSQGAHGSTVFASDYSFLFLLAQVPANPPANECAPAAAKAHKVKRGKKS